MPAPQPQKTRRSQVRHRAANALLFAPSEYAIDQRRNGEIEAPPLRMPGQRGIDASGEVVAGGNARPRTDAIAAFSRKVRGLCARDIRRIHLAHFRSNVETRAETLRYAHAGKRGMRRVISVAVEFVRKTSGDLGGGRRTENFVERNDVSRAFRSAISARSTLVSEERDEAVVFIRPVCKRDAIVYGEHSVAERFIDGAEHGNVRSQMSGRTTGKCRAAAEPAARLHRKRRAKIFEIRITEAAAEDRE